MKKNGTSPVERVIKNVIDNLPNPPSTDLCMFREYAANNGAYVQTNLVVRGTNGKIARIDNLSPAEIGQLTKAGVPKI
jgi:hypothetical protein